DRSALGHGTAYQGRRPGLLRRPPRAVDARPSPGASISRRGPAGPTLWPEEFPGWFRERQRRARVRGGESARYSRVARQRNAQEREGSPRFLFFQPPPGPARDGAAPLLLAHH